MHKCSKKKGFGKQAKTLWWGNEKNERVWWTLPFLDENGSNFGVE